MNKRSVGYALGKLLQVIALVMLVPLAIGLLYSDTPLNPDNLYHPDHLGWSGQNTLNRAVAIGQDNVGAAGCDHCIQLRQRCADCHHRSIISAFCRTAATADSHQATTGC